jgi:hypothetical protein
VQTALRWAAAGARTFDDVRAMDADDTLTPPLPAGRSSLQRLSVEHAEEARARATAVQCRRAVRYTHALMRRACIHLRRS